MEQHVRTLLAVFPTDLGWFGLQGHGDTVTRLHVGHLSAASVRTAVRRECSQNGADADIAETDWFSELRINLQQYAIGTYVDFGGYTVEFGRRTAFGRRVLEIVRRVPYGRTITYGRLASRAGFPRAARAAGSVMAANPVPILIPCHRVIAAGGKLGGYSSPQGTQLKQQLLALEASAAALFQSDDLSRV